MTTRRSFLKGLASLPLIATVEPVVAESEPEEFVGPEILVNCPHCFDRVGRGHMCEGYAKWLREHGKEWLLEHSDT